MTAVVNTRFGIAAAMLSCLLAGYVVAQQVTEEINATQPRDEDADRVRTGQLDRPGTQVDRRESGQTTAQLGQRDSQARAGGESQEVERFYAACLLAKNQAEIELAQFAQQQAQNPQVKQFAQQMVQDHQRIAQQLQQVAGGQGDQSSSRTNNATQSPGLSGQNDAQRQASDTTRLPGSSGAAQTESRTARGLTATGGSQEKSGTTAKLIQIDRKISERQSQAVREELQQKDGAEFDKAYVGTMIHAHMNMLAALETIEQQGLGQLAQVAQQAQPTVQQHLEHAKQLKEQLSGSRTGGAQADRQSPRTQR